MNIKKRLIISNTITVVIPFIITIAAGFIFIFVSSKVFNKDVGYDNLKKYVYIKSQLSDARSTILKQSPDNLEDPNFQQYLSQKLSDINGELILIKNNNVIFTSKNINKIDIEKCLVEMKNTSTKKLIKIDDRYYMIERVPITFKHEVLGRAVLLIPFGQETDLFKKFLAFVVIVFIIAFIIVNIIMSYLFSNRILNPLALLKKSVQEISRGDLNFEIIEYGDGEIKELCADFDKMRIQLKNSIDMKKKYDDNRKMLVSSISHDLKTPMTSIRGYVKGILDGVANTPEKVERYLKIVYSKTEQADNIINDLLLYSNLDLHQIPFNLEKTDIVEYFTYCIDESNLELEKYNIKIYLKNDLKEYRYVKIDRKRFMRVILNIIDNSRKYMDKEQGKINIMLRETNSSIIIELRDNGCGIDKKDVNKIFDRFYRVDSARSEAKGSGLGLAIAKQIVEGQGGKIWAVSHENDGMSILISLAKIS